MIVSLYNICLFSAFSTHEICSLIGFVTLFVDQVFATFLGLLHRLHFLPLKKNIGLCVWFSYRQIKFHIFLQWVTSTVNNWHHAALVLAKWFADYSFHHVDQHAYRTVVLEYLLKLHNFLCWFLPFWEEIQLIQHIVHKNHYSWILCKLYQFLFPVNAVIAILMGYLLEKMNKLPEYLKTG